MKNLEKVDPIVKFKYAGQEKEFKLNFRFLCEYQRETGKNPFQGSWYSNISPLDIVDILTILLKKDNPSITSEEVESNLENTDVLSLTKTIAQMIGFGSADSEQEDSKKK